MRLYRKTNEPGYTGTVITAAQVKAGFDLTAAEATALQGLLDKVDAGTLSEADIESVLFARLDRLPSTGQPAISRQFLLDFLGL